MFSRYCELVKRYTEWEEGDHIAMERTRLDNAYSKRIYSKQKKLAKLWHFHRHDAELMNAGFEFVGSSPWSLKRNDIGSAWGMKKGQRQRCMGRSRGNWNQKEHKCKGVFYED